MDVRSRSRRSGVFAWLVALAVLSTCAGVHAAEPTVSRAPRPAWVTPAEVDLAAPAPAPEAVSNGRRVRLVDRQVRVADGRTESYGRCVMEVTNESGLQDAAQINLDFDPSFESLAMHSVVVHRGGETIDRLDRDAIKIVQREPNLEKQVYDGRRSAVLFVKDLRVHDVIDYDYTLRGSDPTLGGRYEGSFFLGGSEPIEHLRVRLIAPRTARERITLHGPDSPSLAAHEEDRGTSREYSWDLRDTKAYTPEPNTPPWVDPFPWAQVSDFDSWGEVAVWATKLFQSPGALDPAVRAWAEKARAAAVTPDAFILQALRFVQDEVRYVGVEVGMGRRKPASAGAVLARRYGDCKDKTALLVALLRAGGVVARPALVNSAYGPTMSQWGPSPAAFDHVIVRVTTKDDAVYWLDPTRTLEGGRLERYRTSPYHLALTVDESTSDLEALFDERAPPPSPNVRDHFRVADPGSPDETLLDSERVYEGAVADSMRAAFRAQTVAQSGKEFLRMYEQDYPSIREAKPLERFDDRDRDVVRVLAHFAIPKFWTWNAKEGRYRVELPARLLQGPLERPQSTDRKLPLAIPFPFHEAYGMVLDLPFDLPMKPERITAHSSGLEFAFWSACERRTLSYTYELSTSARAVSITKLAEHLEALDKARASLPRLLTYGEAVGSSKGWRGLNGVAVAVVGAFGAIFVWAAYRFGRYAPRSLALEADESPRFRRIGGWLFLLGLSVIAHPFAYLFQMTKSSAVLSAEYWSALATPELATYNPALAYCSIAEIVLNSWLACHLATVAVLFVTKKRGFRFHFVVSAASLVVFRLVDALVLGLVAPSSTHVDAWSGVARALIWAAVWVGYVSNSKRVRGTFVRGFEDVRAVEGENLEAASVE